MILKQLDIYLQRYEPQPKFYIIYKLHSKWITDINVKYNIFRRKYRRNCTLLSVRQRVLRHDSKSIIHKKKKLKIGLHQSPTLIKC